MEQPDDKQVPLNLLITEKEVRLTAGGSAFDPIPLIRDKDNKLDLAALKAKLKDVTTQLPDSKSITLQPEDTVRYEDLVRITDECIGAGIPNVTVSAAI